MTHGYGTVPEWLIPPGVGRLADVWLRPARGGLRNAREATMSLALAVADRLALTDVPDGDIEGALHPMTRDECYEVLRAGSLGRFAYVARAGTPDIVPVNYVVDGEDILIRSGPGPKLQAAERRELVAVETDAFDEGARTGRSVVVIGRAERLRSAVAETGPTPWADGPRRHLIRVRPTRVTGRRLS
jgi:hypothetical protein